MARIIFKEARPILREVGERVNVSVHDMVECISSIRIETDTPPQLKIPTPVGFVHELGDHVRIDLCEETNVIPRVEKAVEKLTPTPVVDTETPFQQDPDAPEPLADADYVYEIGEAVQLNICESINIAAINLDNIAPIVLTPGEPIRFGLERFVTQLEPPSAPAAPMRLIEVDDTPYPNTTLMFDTEYRRWWQDSYAVRAISKGYPERLFTVIEGRLFELFLGDTDDGEKIRRVWRSNPSLQRTHDKFRFVHVYAMGKSTIDVLAKTEQDEERGILTIEETSDVYSQRLGVNLRGRNFIVEIATDSDAAIDRIMVNERFRS